MRLFEILIPPLLLPEGIEVVEQLLFEGPVVGS